MARKNAAAPSLEPPPLDTAGLDCVELPPPAWAAGVEGPSTPEADADTAGGVPVPPYLLGDVVWCWEKEGVRLVPRAAIVVRDWGGGVVDMSAFRHNSLVPRQRRRYAMPPQDGCWTERDPALLEGGGR